MTDAFAFNISSILGLCKKTKFPGTIASFVALVFSLLSYYFFSKTVYVFLFFVFLILGFYAIKTVHKKYGEGDYQWIGIDEWIGIWIANFFLFEFNFGPTKAIIFSFISFLIFRIIDISKFIPPINVIDKDEKQNAYSVIFDDVLAGFYTYLNEYL